MIKRYYFAWNVCWKIFKRIYSCISMAFHFNLWEFSLLENFQFTVLYLIIRRKKRTWKMLKSLLAVNHFLLSTFLFPFSWYPQVLCFQRTLKIGGCVKSNQKVWGSMDIFGKYIYIYGKYETYFSKCLIATHEGRWLAWGGSSRKRFHNLFHCIILCTK